MLVVMSFAVEATRSPLRTNPRIAGRGIRHIFKDSEGYMWYGTTNGLARDDGYSVKIFHLGDAETINSISEDPQRRIWISTDRGAYWIDKSNYNVSMLDSARIGFEPVNSIEHTSDGSIWVNRHGKLSRYNRNLKWSVDFPIRDRANKPAYVTGFTESPGGDIYMTSYSRGVYSYDPKSARFMMDHPIADDVPLGSIIKDAGHNYYWIYDFRGHLYRFSPDAKQEFVRSNVRPPGSPDAHSENLIDMIQDKRSGYLWGVSQNHLLAFRPEKSGLVFPVEIPFADSYSGSIMTSLFNVGDAIYVGSLDRGVSAIYTGDSNTETFRLPEIKLRDGTYPMITALVTADTENLFWLMQNRYGLMLYNLETNESSDYNDFRGLDHIRIRKTELIAPSANHRGVWISLERRLSIYAIANEGMRMEAVDSLSIGYLVKSTTRITRLHEDRHRRLWIGTTDGLFCYDLSSRRFEYNYPDVGNVAGIVESNNDIYVLSKSNGLIKISGNRSVRLDDGRKPLTKGSTLALAPDGNLWIGTTTGRVYEYDRKSGNAIDRTSENRSRLTGSIKYIDIDAQGHGWIVTESTVIEFSKKTGNVFIYTCGKDISLSRILSATNSVESDNTLIIGGVGGIVAIKPNPVLDVKASSVRTLISDATVGCDSRITEFFTDKNGQLSIRFKADDRNVEFHFTTLNYKNADKLRYAYRIADISDDWQFTETGSNKAIFNSLPAGRHILEVRTIDEYGRESTEVTSLAVIRERHAYESRWAILIYIIVSLGLLGGAVYWYRHKVNSENETMWADSEKMMKMHTYLESQVTLPDEEFNKLDRMLIEKATKTVEAQLDNSDFDVKMLCSAVNMSRSTFSRKLKSITGKTPLDFIRDIKMKHACNMLKSGNYTISQISDMLGFSDRRYFTSTFRKMYGMTPRDFQEKCQKEREAKEADAAE